MEGVHPHELSHRFVKLWGDPGFFQDPVLNGPASPPNRLSRPFSPKGRGPIQPPIKATPRMEFPVNLLHDLPPLHVSETKAFIVDGVMVEESLAGDNRCSQAGGKTLQQANYFPEQAQTGADLSGRKTGIHGPFLFGYISEPGAEKSIPSLGIAVDVETFPPRVIDDHEGKLQIFHEGGVGELKEEDRVQIVRSLFDLDRDKPMGFGGMELDNPFILFVQKGISVNLKIAKNRGWNQHPVYSGSLFRREMV